jgi:AGCS family alanine or glycine:cation symporter
MAVVLALGLPVRAQAQEGQEEGSGEAAADDEGFIAAVNETLAPVDGFVADWVVSPLATVFFFDVIFWDTSDEAIVGRALDRGMSAADANAMMDAEYDRQADDPEAARAEARRAMCLENGLDQEQCKDVFSGISLPAIVLWLVFGALFFTLRYRFINLRAFVHAIHVTQGKFDDPDDPGEVSHFQALSSALSATVGLGNIAGVAVAVAAGGPGAVFWMVIAGFLGMSSKFTECTLGQLYRQVDPSGRVSGGPMQYLGRGLAELKRGTLGKVLATMFAIMCCGGSLGGGNMFQANQSAKIVVGQTLTAMNVESIAVKDFAMLIYGIVLALLVGVVIIGGIKRIGAVAGYVVPAMCLVYVVAGIAILLMNAGEVPSAFGKILGEAFSPEAGFGGMLGVLVQGFRRAAFSNEAGIGSASIAHSAAATDEPVREGIVALLEPFIDTIVICTMTGLVLVISDAYVQVGPDGTPLSDVEMTRYAFESQITGSSWVLAFAVFFFAFSTMLSWSYYGERCWTYLFGTSDRMSAIYRVIFLVFVVLGTILNIENVISFSDLMVLAMAFPNILGLYFLSRKVGGALDDYWSRFKSGAMERSVEASDSGNGK